MPALVASMTERGISSTSLLRTPARVTITKMKPAGCVRKGHVCVRDARACRRTCAWGRWDTRGRRETAHATQPQPQLRHSSQGRQQQQQQHQQQQNVNGHRTDLQ